jgi:hypothetical protein
MGLDQFAYKVKNQPDLPAVDCLFYTWDNEKNEYVRLVPKEDIKEIGYFRKHHDLHGWMKNLYRQKGGADPKFNLNNLELTLADLDVLEKDIINDNLPKTTGDFFGSGNTQYYKKKGLQFCKRCRKAIKEGCRVFYNSWW